MIVILNEYGWLVVDDYVVVAVDYLRLICAFTLYELLLANQPNQPAGAFSFAFAFCVCLFVQ